MYCWLHFIQDGKAALAVDSPASDSSAEPAPTRIVSTDKKALKAGGLLLALAGTPVQPADEVDAEKEYELVALA